jgi:hypothetical protein
VAKFLQRTGDFKDDRADLGYNEQGFAVLQALIEMYVLLDQADFSTFFKPDQWVAPLTGLSQWWNGLSRAFQPFWDSESPRFGEADAKGWKSGHQPPSVISETAPHDDWYSQELTSNSADPYSTVLYEDIRPLLVPILTPESRQDAIYSVLTFLGVSLLPPDISTNTSQDPLLRPDIDILWPRPDRVHPWVETPATLRLPDNNMRYWAFDMDTLFSSDWFHATPTDPLTK